MARESNRGVSGILALLGWTDRAVQFIRFRGVIGKLALVAIIGVAGVAWTAQRLSDTNALLIAIGVIAFIVCLFGFGMFVFSQRHPEHATLEGAEMIAFKQTIWAAKGVPEVPASPAIPSPLATRELAGSDQEPCQ